MSKKFHKIFHTILMGVLFLLMAAWIIFLSVMAANSDGKPLFYDYRAGIDVSDQYQLRFTAFSIIFDPLLIFDNFITRFTAEAILYPVIIVMLIRIVLVLLDRLVYRKQLFKGKFISKLAYNLDHGLWFSFLIILIPGIIVMYQSERLTDYSFEYHYFSWMRFFGWIPMSILILMLILSIIQYFKPSFQYSFGWWKKLRDTLHGLARHWERKLGYRILKNGIKEAKVLLFLIMVTFGSIGSLLFFPIHYYTIKPQNLAPDEILLDLHAHTTFSDGVLKPAERVQFYLNYGIHAAAFTDHRNIDGGIMAQEYVSKHDLDFTVIIGEEYSGPGVHINFYGINQSIVDINGTSPSASYLNLNMSDAIHYVKSIGGYVIVNHYESPENAPWSYQQLADWGVDGFEIINGGYLHPEEIRDFCNANGLICISASDEHINPPLRAFTRVRLLDPNNRTVAGIFESLKANPPQAISILIGTLEDQHDLTFEGVFIQYLKDLLPIQLLFWYMWSILLFSCAIYLFQSTWKRIE